MFLLCSLLTIILIYVSTFTLDCIEFVLLIVCFVAIIWLLAMPPKTKGTFELFENIKKWHTIDILAYQELAHLPVKVKDLIQQPIEEMIKNTHAGEEGDLESISAKTYVNAEDTYVGQIENVIERDLFGKETEKTKLVIQEDAFKAMKVEYKKLDAMLTKLREGNIEVYHKLIP